MSVIASSSITLSQVVDISAYYRYYKLQSSTSNPPSKPTSISTLPPSGWSDTEPSYTEGSTNSLYFVDLTVYSDNTFEYSEVSLSSAYEASKQAYNKATQAQTAANNVNTRVDNLDIGGRNLLLDTENMYKWTVQRGANISDGVITFCDTATDLWREALTSFGLPYSYIRNKTVTISCYVKAASGVNDCQINLCLGVSKSKYHHWRRQYRNQHVSFAGTGNWEKVSITVDITDSYFNSGSGSDFENGNIAFRPGAVSTRHNGFQAKKFKLEIGDFATDWTPAPEDAIKGDGHNMFINTYDTSMMPEERYSKPRLKDQSVYTYTPTIPSVAPHGLRVTVGNSNTFPMILFGSDNIDKGTLNGMEPENTYTISFDCTFKVYSAGTALDTSTAGQLLLYRRDNSANPSAFADTENYIIHTYDSEDISDRGQEITKHVEYTFTIPDNTTKCYLMIRNAIAVASHFVIGDFIEVRNLMLEKGMNSSGYIPSSYDLERISYNNGNLFANSDTFEDWALTSVPVEIVDGITDYKGRNLLGNTGNLVLPSYGVSDARNTFGVISGYNTPTSAVTSGSYDDSSNYLTATETATGNRGIGWYTKPGTMINVEALTFSCMVKASKSTNVHLHLGWRNGSATASYTGWPSLGSTTIEANTWTRFSYTFSCQNASYPNGECIIGMCFTGDSSGLTWQVAHAKLEKGSVATDWTPAPEDTDPDDLPAVEIDEDGAKIIHWPEVLGSSVAWRGILSGNNDKGTYIPYSKIKNKRITLSLYVKYANASYDLYSNLYLRSCYISYGLCPQDNDTRTRWVDLVQPYSTSSQWKATTDWQRIYFTTYVHDGTFISGDSSVTVKDSDRLVIRFYNHSTEECWIKKPMLTIGTVVEDWTPNQYATTANVNSINDNVNMLSDTLSNTSQNLDSLTQNYNAYTASTNDELSSLSTNVNTALDVVSNVDTKLDNYIADTQKYLRYNAGTGTLQLGAITGDKLSSSLDLTSNRLEFKLYDSNGVAIKDNSYMTAKMLYNKNVQTTNAFIMGNPDLGRFTFVNLGSGLAFGLADDLLNDDILVDTDARSGDSGTSS